jgi:hypothetical protein
MGTLPGNSCKELDMSRLTVCRWLYQAVSIASCLVVGTSVQALGQQSKSPYRIIAVKAFLYLNEKDSLSENIVDNPLTREPISVQSDAILITVEFAGKPGSYVSGRMVHLTVRKPDGSVLVDRRQRIGLFPDDGKWFETSVVYRTTGWCDTLRIHAEILGQKEPSVIEKKIPFVCGD